MDPTNLMALIKNLRHLSVSRDSPPSPSPTHRTHSFVHSNGMDQADRKEDTILLPFLFILSQKQRHSILFVLRLSFELSLSPTRVSKQGFGAIMAGEKRERRREESLKAPHMGPWGFSVLYFSLFWRLV
ncbi:hypothetical protein GPALN_011245 [Globodera pallida]|nr:hypothetical protein GPALN_011245 [Globodera pallida]